METATEIKPSVWKAKKMFWFDREPREEERKYGHYINGVRYEYESKIRVMVVMGLRDDNTSWYGQGELRGGHGLVDPKIKLENANRAMDMASFYGDPQPPMTGEEWKKMVEEDRIKVNGTYFDETSIPYASNGSEDVPSV